MNILMFLTCIRVYSNKFVGNSYKKSNSERFFGVVNRDLCLSFNLVIWHAWVFFAYLTDIFDKSYYVILL